MVPMIHKVYPSRHHSIGVFFDTDDSEQAKLYLAMRNSFGERFALAEEILAPRYRFLGLPPGGLREVRR